MRTTVDIDDPILREVKALQEKEGRSLGALVSELLADALARRRAAQTPAAFRWASRPTGLVAGTQGLQVHPAMHHFDLWVMVAVALACLPVFMTGCQIARWEGAVFVGYYLAYTAYLVLTAQQHDAALSAFSAVMLGFVVPLTVITLVVMLVRSAGQH